MRPRSSNDRSRSSCPSATCAPLMADCENDPFGEMKHSALLVVLGFGLVRVEEQARILGRQRFFNEGEEFFLDSGLRPENVEKSLARFERRLRVVPICEELSRGRVDRRVQPKFTTRPRTRGGLLRRLGAVLPDRHLNRADRALTGGCKECLL